MQEDKVFDDIKDDYLDDISSKLGDLSLTVNDIKENGADTQKTYSAFAGFNSLKSSATIFNFDFVIKAANDALHFLDIYEKESPSKSLHIETVNQIINFLIKAVSLVKMEKWSADQAFDELDKMLYPEDDSVQKKRVLVVGADRIYSSMIRDAVDSLGAPADFVKTETDAFSMLTKREYGVMISSYYLSKIDAVKMLAAARVLHPEIEGVLITSKDNAAGSENFSSIIKKDSSFKSNIESILTEKI